MAFTVAIVGRPNVGKSTLFNRLIGRRLALVDNRPGVTRDRREGDAVIGDLAFRIVDTAGLEEADDRSMEGRMRKQTEAAVSQADVALFMVDAKAGMTPVDRHFAGWLRRQSKPVILVANKCDASGAEAGVLEAFALGIGEPIAVSAEHGDGFAELHEAVAKYAPATARQDIAVDETPPLRIAIVGRPNAGKSTLANQLVGEERMLTGPEPGLTRDSISINWEFRGHAVRLVDTAGLRRKSRVEEKLEKLSVGETLRAIRLAEVVVLVIDGHAPHAEGIDTQDLSIADLVVREGRALVIAVNKWDAVEDRAKTLQAIEDRLQTSLPQVKGVPIITLSALTGRHVDRLMPAVVKLHEAWNKRISTNPLNKWLQRMVARHPPPAVRGRHLRIRYATQIKTRPPTFALFSTSKVSELPESYVRYLAGGMRETFGLQGVPIRILIRKGSNPYEDKD